MSNTKILPLSVLDHRPLAKRYSVTFLDRMPATPPGYKAVAYGKWPGTNFRVVTYELVEEDKHERPH